MMRTDVIYTRYSSDMQREESCEDQEREVRAGLERRGLDHSDAFVMHDRAESGTKNYRSVFEQLTDMVRRGEVRILAVDDQARFSRADNAFAFIKDVVFHGGRFISTGEGIDTEQEGWELRVKVMELHNSTTIRELGRRVRRGQKGRVLDDGAAGDHPYGYESYYLDPAAAAAPRRGPKPKKGLRVLESEARWVRQVFDWFANEGTAISEIARELTRLGVDKGSKSTKPGWHHQQVHRMLENEKYVGRWPWGKTKVLRDSTGRKKQVPVAEGQEVVRDRPELRIVDEVTWETARRRLAELKDQFGLKPGDRPAARRSTTRASIPAAFSGAWSSAGPAGRGSGAEGAEGGPTSGARTTARAPARWPRRFRSTGPRPPSWDSSPTC